MAAAKKLPKICTNCKQEFTAWRNPHTKHFCCLKCRVEFSRGKNHSDWKGGRWADSQGYIYITLPFNKHRAEHVLKAEKVLGRRLKLNETVHHIDGNKSNNENSNLLICTKSYHAWLHHRMSYLYQQEHFCGK